MDPARIQVLAALPRPSAAGVIADLRAPLEYANMAGRGGAAGAGSGCLNRGVWLDIRYPQAGDFPETACASLRRLLAVRGIPECAAGYPLRLRQDPGLGAEAYRLTITPLAAELAAADADGLRRGIYFLEDRLRSVAGASLPVGSWERRPHLRRRISRCFFGPTYRPPFWIDELSNDEDYYPEEYLNKLAHEGVNGLWLSMYFRDLPSSLFPGRGVKAPQRLAKLRRTVEKCRRYGIRLYVFFSEPKLFGDAYYAVPKEEAAAWPELYGDTHADWTFFCTSMAIGQRYLRESVECLFREVPGLGGMINIMFGEDNGACVSHLLGEPVLCHCPRCSARPAGEIYREMAQTMQAAMRRHNAEAELIGWFYAPGQRDGTPFSGRLAALAEAWPDSAAMMFNAESGARVVQLGQERRVLDYSLAYPGVSELFRQVAGRVARPAAKLQVGCSHELASVPFLPVPGNLYEKYRLLRELGVGTVMQCWYFGNYPGLMNKAAGELAFEPFPASEGEFLLALAQPDWGIDAPQVVRAWQHFAAGYRQFPVNLAFSWYGPLHHCLVWPWHLFPVDQPIAPSWKLQAFPEVSGDRIGESLGFHHTLAEALELCGGMLAEWERGNALLQELAPHYAGDQARSADIRLAGAIALQMRSARNLLQFYHWREEMLYTRADHLDAMRALVLEEIGLAGQMAALCRQDPRLGYHSEAEGYLFFPEKLEKRQELLQALLDEDFPRFSLSADWIPAYTGEKPAGLMVRAAARPAEAQWQTLTGAESARWRLMQTAAGCLELEWQGLDALPLTLEIEPCRMWAALAVTVTAAGEVVLPAAMCRELPAATLTRDGKTRRLRLPLDFFAGYRRPGFPMRINVRGPDFSWAPGSAWPSRLLHGDYHPARTGWLLLA